MENYFGHQCSLGAMKDNPSLQDFGFNDNAIRNEKIFRPIAGNVRDGQGQSNIEFPCESTPSQKKLKKLLNTSQKMQTFPALSVFGLDSGLLCYKNGNFILK